MTLPMVTCPLCCQPGFNTSDALCSALVNASTRKFFCPVCNEMLIGLDKLTIHLFGHNSQKNVNSASPNNLKSGISNGRDDGDSLSTPLLYFQSETGQLFALAPSSLFNQFGAVTINTQNYISNTCVSSGTSFVHNQNPKKPAEFSSCKDLLTSCDFSEPVDELVDDTAQPNCTMRLNENELQQNFEDSPPAKFDETTTKSTNQNVDERSTSACETPLESESAQLILCDVCEVVFTNKAILAVHKQLMHKNRSISDPEGSVRSTEKFKRKPLTCNWCSASFNLKSSLIVHVKVTHPAQKESFEKMEVEKVTCPVCEKSFPKESALNKHMKAAHGEKPWQCTVCSKSFTTKYFLRKHKRIHTGETPYECAICHKVFTFQQSYHKHMLYHTDDKPYCCSHCGRLFKELSTLNNHERIHSGEKPFTCETCGKSFRQRVSYLVHRRIHTGAMPYKCTACDKSFRYKISQRTHKCPEHPPGIVVKTHKSLVDRLQAAINLEENGTFHPPPKTLESVCGSGSSLAKTEDTENSNSIAPNFSIPGSSKSSQPFTSEPSGDPPDPDRPMVEGATHSTPNGSAFPDEVSFHELLTEGPRAQTAVDPLDVFSMNLDSSPSECLGKLHISSEEFYKQTDGCSPATQKSPLIPAQGFSFDNMEDLDLCNLLFDVS